MPTLYIIATPIGNLKDISERALETLKRVDLILCEDTRVTQKLLNHYQIKTSVLSYYQHSKIKKINYILSLLKQGKDLALVSDAGTPGISDPGGKLIESALKETKDLKIIPIPGPSALITAVSVSGIAMDRFIFMGFPPQKKKRKKFFEEVVNSKYPVIFYESPYRIIKSLHDLRETDPEKKSEISNGAGAKQDTKLTRKVVVCRELTKKFETIYRGEIRQVIKEIEKLPIKGEFVVIVEADKPRTRTRFDRSVQDRRG